MPIYFGTTIALRVEFGGRQALNARHQSSICLLGNKIDRLNASLRLYGEWSDYKAGAGTKSFSWAWARGEDSLGEDPELDAIASRLLLEAVRWESPGGGEADQPVESFYYQWHANNPGASVEQKFLAAFSSYPVKEVYEKNYYAGQLLPLRHSVLYEARLTALDEKYNPLTVSDPVFFVIPYISTPIY